MSGSALGVGPRRYVRAIRAQLPTPRSVCVVQDFAYQQAYSVVQVRKVPMCRCQAAQSQALYRRLVDIHVFSWMTQVMALPIYRAMPFQDVLII